jgi:hypothetical protein
MTINATNGSHEHPRYRAPTRIPTEQYKKWTSFIDKKARALRKELKCAQGHLEAIHHASFNWGILPQYQKMNLLTDLSTDFCRILGLSDIRLFSKNSWSSYKAASLHFKQDYVANFEIAEQGCYVSSEGDNFSPMVILYMDNEILNDLGLFPVVSTLGHEIGHYCLDVYYRFLNAPKRNDPMDHQASSYFKGVTTDVKTLTDYLDVMNFLIEDEVHILRKANLLEEIYAAIAREDYEHHETLTRKYLRLPDEQGADYVGKSLSKTIQSLLCD